MTSLGETRRDELQAIARERFDVLVVGGGVTGTGALLDATSRGLRAALIEQDDIASGTSSRSSRLIHGGLRYLEQFRIGLVREALEERSRLLELAPHLVRLEPLLFPIYGWPLVHRVFYETGMTLYDVLGARRDGGWHRFLSPAATLEHAPDLEPKGLQGSLLYHDGAEDDARYTLSVGLTAVAGGARILTRVRACELLLENGRAAGVVAEDRLTGERLELRADHVIDATGVWAARPDAPFGRREVPIVPSRGTHILVARDRIRSRSALTIRVPGKVIFILPLPRHWIIGTTDVPYDGPVDHPGASAAEVAELLGIVAATTALRLEPADIVGTYAGLRPLVGTADSGSTVKASREHKVTIAPSGLVRVSGGKYTTYRVMAKDAVDAALSGDAARPASRTADLPLVGAAPLAELEALGRRLADEHRLDPAVAARLVERHGTQATDVAALGAELDLIRRLGPEIDHLEVEVAWAARREWALSLDDVLARRMRLSVELADRGAAIAPRVAELLGAELGWDPARRDAEVREYLASAHREYDVPDLEGVWPARAVARPAPVTRPAAAP